MSALGHKQTYAVQHGMSALPLKATAKADTCSLFDRSIGEGVSSEQGDGFITRVNDRLYNLSHGNLQRRVLLEGLWHQTCTVTEPRMSLLPLNRKSVHQLSLRVMVLRMLDGFPRTVNVCFTPESGHDFAKTHVRYGLKADIWFRVRRKTQRAFGRHRRRISICIGDVLLSICFGRSRWPRWQLKHNRLLIFT